MEELRTRVNLAEEEYGTNIVMQRNEKKVLRISFLGNLDLYFSLDFDDEEDTSFIISKDNCQVFYIFDRLYKSILNAQIHEEYPSDLDFDELRSSCNADDSLNYWIELQILFDKVAEINAWYKKIGSCIDLVKNDGSIVWLCDDYPKEEAPSFRIKKLDDDNYEIFFTRPDIKSSYFHKGSIAVRIRNYNSRYNPFNVLFMQMFNSLCEIPNDSHQGSLEEYIYKLEKKPD